MVTTRERNHEMAEKIREAKEKHDPQPLVCPAGTFFCDGHLDFLPLEKQSSNTRYCQECLTVVEESTPQLERDYWVPNQGIFITGGEGLGLTPDLRSVCLGTEQEILARLRQKTTPAATLPTGKALKKPQPRDATLKETAKLKTTRSQTQQALQNTPTEVKPPIGRPRKDLPVAKIMKLHRRGLGSRAITNELERTGIRISHVTVHRLIKGQLMLPLEGS